MRLKPLILLTTLEGLLTLVLLLTIPKNPQNSILFGYSYPRLILFSGMIGLEVILLWLSTQFWQKLDWAARINSWVNERIATPWTSGLGLNLTVFGALFSAFLLFLTPITTNEYYASILDHIYPVLIWGLLVCVQISALIIGTKGVEQWKNWGREFWEYLCTPFTENNMYVILLWVIILIAIIDRLAFISQPIRYDEALTLVKFASSSFYYSISNYSVPNNHIFHTILVRLSLSMFGSGLETLRFPAFAAGVLIILVAYVAGSKLFNPHVGLLSAALLAPSSTLIEFSTNARGYTLICLFTLLLVIVAVYLKDNLNPIAWIFFVVLSVAGAFTIPIMLYPFGGVMIWLLLSHLFKDTGEEYGQSFLVYLGAAGVNIGFLTWMVYLPVLTSWGVESITGNIYVSPRSWRVLPKLLPENFISTWNTWTRDMPEWFGLLLLLGIIFYFLFQHKLSTHRTPFFLALALWIVPLLIIQRVVPFQRVWLFLLPPVIIFIAAGWHGFLKLTIPIQLKLNPNLINLSILCITIWLSWMVINSDGILNSPDTGTLREAEEIALYIQNEIPQEVTVLASTPSRLPLRYYFAEHGVTNRIQEKWRGETNTSMLIVINLTKVQTIDRVVDKILITDDSLSVEYRLNQEFEAAVLYELDIVKR